MQIITRKKNFGIDKLHDCSIGDQVIVICECVADLQRVVQICYNAKDRYEGNKHYHTTKNRKELFVQIDVEKITI